MVAHAFAHASEVDSPLDFDTRAEVADLRAHNLSWEAVAAQVQWDADDLQRAVRRDPLYDDAYHRAERAVEREAAAEAIVKLRLQMRDSDAEIARKGTEVLVRHLDASDRNRTRLEVEKVRARAKVEVEKLRCETRIAVANAKGAKVKARAEQPEPTPEPTPEELERERKVEEGIRARERQRAEEWARDQDIVYLWGGCHGFGVAPDATDTPLRLMRDLTVPGRAAVYWALTDPMPVDDPVDGPFLEPPGCRPRGYGADAPREAASG